MWILVDGELVFGVVVKDIILYIIFKLGVGGGIGYFVEYVGLVICGLSMEGWMIICNMSIEMGVCGGMIVLD